VAEKIEDEDDLSKSNENHDDKGQFSSGGGSGAAQPARTHVVHMVMADSTQVASAAKQMVRSVRVTAKDDAHAEEKAKAFFRARGYKNIKLSSMSRISSEGDAKKALVPFDLQKGRKPRPMTHKTVAVAQGERRLSVLLRRVLKDMARAAADAALASLHSHSSHVKSDDADDDHGLFAASGGGGHGSDNQPGGHGEGHAGQHPSNLANLQGRGQGNLPERDGQREGYKG
jgi:hypothetical protein